MSAYDTNTGGYPALHRLARKDRGQMYEQTKPAPSPSGEDWAMKAADEIWGEPSRPGETDDWMARIASIIRRHADERIAELERRLAEAEKERDEARAERNHLIEENSAIAADLSRAIKETP